MPLMRSLIYLIRQPLSASFPFLSLSSTLALVPWHYHPINMCLWIFDTEFGYGATQTNTRVLGEVFTGSTPEGDTGFNSNHTLLIMILTNHLRRKKWQSLMRFRSVFWAAFTSYQLFGNIWRGSVYSFCPPFENIKNQTKPTHYLILLLCW